MRNFTIAIGSALATLATTPAYANYIETAGNDEECTSVGNACVAREGSMGSFYSNPAAITDFERPRIGVNLRVLDTRSLDLIDSGGARDIPGTNTKGDLAVSPTLAGYLPISDKVVVGMGIGAPYAITADWGNDSGIHRYNMSDQALFILDLAPTVGLQVTDKLSVGVSVSITALKHLRTETLIPDSFGAALPPALGGAGVVIPTTPNSPTIGSITLNTRNDFAIGLPPDNLQAEFGEAALVLGLRYDVSDALTIGLAARTETKTDFKGNATLAIPGLGVDQTVPFNLTLDMPGHIRGGFAFRPMPGTELSAEIQQTFWSSAQGFGNTPAVIEFGTPLLGFINDLQINYDANDATTLRFGVSQALSSAFQLRAGHAWEESIFPDSNVDILTYDSDRNVFSLGGRFDTRRGDNTKPGWIFNASFQLIDYAERVINAGESQNLGGVSLPNLPDADTLSFVANRDTFTYGGAIKAFSLGVQYAF